MKAMAELRNRLAKEGKLLDRLIALKAKGNIAPVVAGNDCPRRTTCMWEITAIHMYEGRGRKVIVPPGCNPFAKSQREAA